MDLLSFIMRNIFILLCFLTQLQADVRSTNGTLNFDTQSDENAEMVLNSTGLGIGITPTANSMALSFSKLAYIPMNVQPYMAF